MSRAWLAFLAVGAWLVFLSIVYALRFANVSRWFEASLDAGRSCFAAPHPHFVNNLVHAGRCAAAFIFLALVVWALGDVLQRRILPALAGVDRPLAKLGLGAALLHFVLFALAACGLWYPPLLLTFGAACALYSLSRIFAARRELPALIRSAASYFRDRWFLALGLVWVLLAGVEGLAPETGPDALTYHVAVPNQWLAEHGFFLIRGHYSSNLPLPNSLYYGFLLAVGPNDSTGLFQPAMLLLGAVALLRLTSYYADTSRLPIELWALLSVPALNIYLETSGNDQFTLALFSLGLLFGLSPRRDPAELIVAFLFLGLGLSAKFTAVPSALLAAAFITFEWLRRGGARRPLWVALIFLFLPWALWAAKSAYFTGNPVYPLLTDIFGERHLYPEGIARAVAANRSQIDSVLELLAFPVIATFSGSFFHSPGIVWLALGPPAIFAGVYFAENRKRALSIVAFLAAGWIAWALLYDNARYSASLFAASGAAISVAIHRTAGRFERLRPALFVVAGAFLFWSSLVAWSARMDLTRPWTYLCGRYDEVDYVTKQDLRATVAPSDAMYRILNESLEPTQNKVLVIGESRTANLRIPHLWGTEFDRPIFETYVAGADSAAEVGRRIRKEGITYIAINLAMGTYCERFGYKILTLGEAEQKLWSEFFTRSVELVARTKEGSHNWAIVKLLPEGIEAPTPIADFVAEARQAALQ